MPITMNTVILEGSDDEIAALKQFVESEKSDFDFNKILPVPDELNIGDYHKAALAKSCYRSMNGPHKPKHPNKTFEALAELGARVITNEEKYGVGTDRDWRKKNWGTFTTANEILKADHEYIFKTVSPIVPLITKLGELFPNVMITYSHWVNDGAPKETVQFNYKEESNE